MFGETSSIKISKTKLLFKNRNVMEDIGKKAHDDEFNKGKEDIGREPRKFIPVPKVDKKGDKAKKPDKCKK